MKNLNKLSLIIFFLISAKIFSACNTTNISGNHTIAPDASGYGYEFYSISVGSNWVWSSNASTGLNALGANGFSTNGLTISPAVTNCVIRITVTYDTDNGSECDYIDVVVLPYINSSNCFYPGEPKTVSLHDNCGGHPTGTGCTYGYLWNVAPANYCSSCGANGSAFQVVVPTNPGLIQSAFTVNCTINCTSWSPITNLALASQGYYVCLHNPVITGPPGSTNSMCVGCEVTNPTCPASSGNINLSCNYVPGAGYYNWVIVSGNSIQIVSGQGTQNIVLNAVAASGVTIIKVIAQTSQSNPQVTSASNNFYVTVCCLSNIMVNNIVNSPDIDTQQASVAIDATSSINSGASGEYHAGNQLALLPGFNSAPGSYFHGYIATCNSGYYRMINSDPVGSDNLTDNNIEPADRENYLAVNNQVIFDNKTIDEVTITPNPTIGAFKVSTSKNLGCPKQIIIRDVMNKEIIINNRPMYETQFNLENENPGVYMISIYYSDKVTSKKVIKQ